MCFDEVTLSGFYVECRWGQGEQTQKSIELLIVFYVRHWLGVPVTTVGVFEGAINRHTGGWSGWDR